MRKTIILAGAKKELGGLLKMFPDHYSTVCYKEVSFPLTEENIVEESIGKIVAHNTNYIILTNGREWAVAALQKSKMPEDRTYFFKKMVKKIGKIEIVSLPEDTAFVKDQTVNVNNPSLMASVAGREDKKTVVVLGKFEHMSFISDEKTVPLVVFDFSPPKPPKLIDLVLRALDTGRLQKTIKMVPNILDLNKLARASDKPFAMFMCLTSDSNCGKNILSLVGARSLNISSKSIGNIVHLGCDPSLKMFKSLYGKKPEFIDICPLHRQKKRGVKSIARCCKISEGYLRIGDTAYVSFDPKLFEVEEAIMDLFEQDTVRASSYRALPALEFLISLVLTVLRRI